MKPHGRSLFVLGMVLLLHAGWMTRAAPAVAQDPGQSPVALRETGVILDTASTRFKLTSAAQGLLLRSMVDIPSGTEFLPQAGKGLSIWEIVLLNRGKPYLVNPERKLVAVQAGPGAKVETFHADTGATVYRLAWPKLDLPAEPGALGVAVKIVAPPATGLSYWYISVANRSKDWGTWEVRFPRLERLGPVGDPAGDRFLDPQTQGRLTPNPYLNLQKASYVRDMPVQTAGQSVHYPGYASFQMCALYNPERAGLYYAAYDGQGYYKHFSFGPKEDSRSLDLYLRHFPEGQGLPGTGYTSPFPVVVGTFKGDWLTAAKLYRQWAEKQIWCSGGKLGQRADVPRWYKDLAVWEFITENNYAGMHSYRSMLGLPWANHWNYIWKDKSQGDRGSPDLFPPKGGEEQMRKETAKLTGAGIYTVPYFLGSCLDVKSPQYAEWDMEKVLVRGGESHYALGNPNVPYIWVYSEDLKFGWPCPHLDFWPDKAEKIVKRIMEMGVTGVYLDTTTGNAYQCFSKDHGHSVGGGNYWAQGNRRLLKRIRAAVKNGNPQGIVTGENPCEIYNDLVDGYLLYVAHFPTHVPAFQAIYHDYVGTYGQFLSSPARIGADYPFMLPMGICFINGDQFGCTARTDHTMQAQGAADMAWLSRLAHFRVKVVNRYVGLGEMMRPPKLETKLPEVSGWWWPWSESPPWITRTVTRPAVIHSAWRASDGSIGIVFLNISEQPQQIAFSLQGDQYGFPRGANLAVRGLGLDKDKNPTRAACDTLKGGMGRIEHTLEPRGMWALEVKPTVNP
ncbi:MAG: hypothetical protein HY360_27245 [Verrucomicrobia bacterium]|nr:hypothetical protein [Verrucomicrobiota bacterium]